MRLTTDGVPDDYDGPEPSPEEFEREEQEPTPSPAAEPAELTPETAPFEPVHDGPTALEQAVRAMPVHAIVAAFALVPDFCENWHWGLFLPYRLIMTVPNLVLFAGAGGLLEVWCRRVPARRLDLPFAYPTLVALAAAAAGARAAVIQPAPDLVTISTLLASIAIPAAVWFRTRSAGHRIPRGRVRLVAVLSVVAFLAWLCLIPRMAAAPRMAQSTGANTRTTASR